MVIHKYIFFIDDNGIRTYKYKDNSIFEIFKYKGEVIYKNRDKKSFYEWFEKAASIAIDDKIDFCFLSNKPIETEFLKYTTKKISSWSKESIINFCNNYIKENNYEIIIDDTHKFISQVSNIYNKDSIDKLYLKCFPEFRFENNEISKVNDEETSVLSKYFIEILNDL